jgi:two-component system, OmpR family, sensor kinase
MNPEPAAPRRARHHSLRARLLWLLLAAVSLATAIQSAVTYTVLLREADAILDYQMQQVALSLRGALRSAPGTAPIIDAEGLALVIRIWSVDGTHFYESAARARMPLRAVPGFVNLLAEDGLYRVFSLQSGRWVIQVAQDLTVRRTQARALALRTVLPVALLAPLLMLAVWWVVSLSLGPIIRTRRQIAARALGDLSPLSDRGLPEEVQVLVHELNLLFERLRHAIDAQRDFVGDAAHELRSPLAALRLQAQAVERAPSDEARRTAIRRLQAGVDRATRVVEQLLALARQETVEVSRGELEQVELAELARSVLSDLAPHAADRHLGLELRGDGPWTLRGDPESLRMLVRNLVENAVRYTPADGSVRITLQRAQAMLRLDVDDSGPGIAPELRERAFGRFHRLPGADPGGSGLGLAIVRRVAERHGAQVTLDESDRLGGLRVRVEFPHKAELAP